MTRDRSIDIAKGVAILFVYIGHSILYHSIQMNGLVFRVLDSFILTFHMPMFFMISGYLFAWSRKKNSELYKGKFMRLIVPYLFTMAIVICSKMVLPSSMAVNRSVDGGLLSMLRNMLLEGGDRWFVYSLFIIFALLIPLRKLLCRNWVCIAMIVTLAVVSHLDVMPKMFMLNDVCYYMIFFIAGYALKEHYKSIKEWALRYWYVNYLMWITAYFVSIHVFHDIAFTGKFLLPFTGTLGAITIAFQLERLKETNYAVRYISYCGKYSLQFYLFTFCYPIIRTVIVSVLHITNQSVIFFSVLFLQLIAITIIVEITKRIKWLKVPMGY